jgi:hypothetical protein
MVTTLITNFQSHFIDAEKVWLAMEAPLTLAQLIVIEFKGIV